MREVLDKQALSRPLHAKHPKKKTALDSRTCSTTDVAPHKHPASPFFTSAAPQNLNVSPSPASGVGVAKSDALSELAYACLAVCIIVNSACICRIRCSVITNISSYWRLFCDILSES